MVGPLVGIGRYAIFAVFIWAGSACAADPTAAGDNGPQPSGNGEEQVLTGRELMASCTDKSGEQSEQGRFCMTFVVGLVQTVSQMQLSGQSPPLFCIDPNKISPEAVRDSAVKWMQARPERGGEEAYVLVSEALHQAYPCAVGPAGGPAPASTPAPAEKI
ncbi:MAG: Rap1a/Tai family immunity protein [Gammaproteobacteria bacterium]